MCFIIFVVIKVGRISVLFIITILLVPSSLNMCSVFRVFVSYVYWVYDKLFTLLLENTWKMTFLFYVFRFFFLFFYLFLYFVLYIFFFSIHSALTYIHHYYSTWAILGRRKKTTNKQTYYHNSWTFVVQWQFQL